MKDQYKKAMSHLSQAMSVALNCLGNAKAVQDAKVHMNRAMVKLQEAQKEQKRHKESTTSWWDGIVAGVANQPVANFSPEGHAKNLEQINKMITDEQNKLAELQKASINIDTNDSLIID